MRLRREIEKVFGDIGEFTWGIIWGTIRLCYYLPKNIVTLVLPFTILAFVWMILSDGLIDLGIAAEYIGEAIIIVFKILATAIDAVANFASSAISDVSEFFGGPSVSLPEINIPSVTELLGSWIGVVMNVEETCGSLDTWWKVLFAFAKLAFSGRVCYLLRFVSVEPLAAVPLELALGWLSYPWLPIPGQNCVEPEGELLCAILKLWIVIRDFVIPLIYITTVLESYKLLVRQLLWMAWDLFKLVMKTLGELIHYFTD